MLTTHTHIYLSGQETEGDVCLNCAKGRRAEENLTSVVGVNVIKICLPYSEAVSGI